MSVIYQDEWVTLHCARWQDVELPQCDAVITDTPYSERTHAAYSPRTDVLTACERDARWAAAGGVRREINYEAWSDADVEEAAAAWTTKARGWVCILSDDVLAPLWRTHLRANDRYSFAPVTVYEPGSRVRLAGDGPSNWSTYLMVSRPKAREFQKWGTLPGGYATPTGCGTERKPVVGGKALWLMRAIVRDYSRPGDLVIDPCAGGGTTALACRLEGRRCITVECDPATAEIARRRLSLMPVEQPTGQLALLGDA